MTLRMLVGVGYMADRALSMMLARYSLSIYALNCYIKSFFSEEKANKVLKQSVLLFPCMRVISSRLATVEILRKNSNMSKNSG